MENAAEALKMAAAVLIFVLALSISINAFGEARQAITTVIQDKDSQYNIELEIGHIKETGTDRIVSVEAIVPVIYRAYLENYKIVFKDCDSIFGNGIFQIENNNGIRENVYEIDFDSKNQNIGNDTRKMQLINAILYGTEDRSIVDYFKMNSKIYLNNSGIYDTIKRNKFYEKLGIYYPDEIFINEDGENQLVNNEVPDVNKKTKRVITYKLKTD